MGLFDSLNQQTLTPTLPQPSSGELPLNAKRVTDTQSFLLKKKVQSWHEMDTSILEPMVVALASTGLIDFSETNNVISRASALLDENRPSILSAVAESIHTGIFEVQSSFAQTAGFEIRPYDCFEHVVEPGFTFLNRLGFVHLYHDDHCLCFGIPLPQYAAGVAALKEAKKWPLCCPVILDAAQLEVACKDVGVSPIA